MTVKSFSVSSMRTNGTRVLGCGRGTDTVAILPSLGSRTSLPLLVPGTTMFVVPGSFCMVSLSDYVLLGREDKVDRFIVGPLTARP
jgi:hypothetical protein